jgi:ABC-2 type transport system ATP-binding protein
MINDGGIVFDDSVGALKQRFLRRKRIELKLVEPMGELGLPGVTVVRNEAYDVVVEVDTEVLPIEVAVARLVGIGGLADLTIEDPPLEQIIAAMYRAEAVAT